MEAFHGVWGLPYGSQCGDRVEAGSYCSMAIVFGDTSDGYQRHVAPLVWREFDGLGWFISWFGNTIEHRPQKSIGK